MLDKDISYTVHFRIQIELNETSKDFKDTVEKVIHKTRLHT